MGLPISNARFALDYVIPFAPAGGYVVLLGVPEVKFSQDRFVALCQDRKVKGYEPQDPFNGVTLWRGFGYDTIVLDANSYEGADKVVDLNCPVELDVPASIIFDPGTLEHVFNIPQALENIVNMLSVGGMVMHHNPLAGWTNHGYYTPSPCLFHEFYEANGFSNIRTGIADLGFRLSGQDDSDRYQDLPYDPMGCKRLSQGRWVQYTTAKKVRITEAKRVLGINRCIWPTQRRYSEHLWK